MAPLVKVVVVTGAGGFVGTELTKLLLEKGYHVRATARKASSPSVAHLLPLAEALPGKLEIHEADLTNEGSFDKVLEGAYYLFHTASPAEFGNGDPISDQKTVVDPAVEGTKTVIQAAAKAKVQRVVLTSSVVTLFGDTPNPPKGPILGPSDFNEVASMKPGDHYEPYAYSKVKAEKVAWKLAKELGLDLVTILPSMVIGPVYSTRGGFSADSAAGLVAGKSFATIYTPLQIDSRDVGAAHVAAAEIPSANGRYILSHDKTVDFKAISDALKTEFPELDIQDTESKPPYRVLDNSKVSEELGLRLIPATRSYVDAARTILSLDYIKPAYK